MDSESLLMAFEHLFRRFSAWYRLRRTIAWLIKGLIFGMSLALGFSIVELLLEGLLKNEYFTIILQFSVLSLVIAALAGFVWPVSKEQLARFFDQYYGLKERCSTSLELLEERKENILFFNPEQALVEEQLKDTLSVSSQLHPLSRFYLRASRLQVILAGSLVIGLVLLSVFGEPLFQRSLQQRMIQQAIAQEAARLDTLAQQIRDNDKLSPSQREQIAQTLEEAAKKLNQAQTAEQAVAVLSSTQNQLQALESGQAQQQAENLQNVGKHLLEKNQPGTDAPLKSFAQHLAEGDNLAAAQDLANLDLSQLSPEQASSLAEQLDEAAQTSASTNPQLSQQMADASQAIRDGDFQAAQQALQQAAQALANTGQQIAQSQAASQAAGQVNQGQDRLIQAGQSQNQQAQTGTGAQSGQGQGSQGQTSNNQAGISGNSPGGSGAGQGESTGQEGEGPPAGTAPIGQNNQAGNGGLSSYEEIYTPQRLGGSGGAEVALPGTGQGGDQVVGQGDTTPGDQNASHVPYVDVLPNYTEAYRQAVESGQVPVGLRALVKKYFSSLEP